MIGTCTREELHRHFGGVIYASDFETNFSGETYKESPTAKRIMCDWRREKSWINKKNDKKKYEERGKQYGKR